jgi:hypothetical protein
MRGGVRSLEGAFIAIALAIAGAAFVVIDEPLGAVILLVGALVGLVLAAVPRIGHRRVAAVLFLLSGLGSVVAMPGNLHYIAAHRDYPLTFFGVRALVGPFDALGLDAVLVLGWLWVAMGSAEIVVGALVWRGRRLGRLLAYALFPPGLLFWSGFGVPLWMIVGPARIILLARGWAQLESDRRADRLPLRREGPGEVERLAEPGIEPLVVGDQVLRHDDIATHRPAGHDLERMSAPDREQ